MYSPLATLAEPLRGVVGSAVRTMLGGDAAEPGPAHASVEDPGLFGPDSATWRVHNGPSGLVGGLRALLLQTMHPLAMAGVAQHSNFREDPFGRLHRTSAFVGTTTYGTTPEAERAIAIVRRVHERIVGVAPDGRPYRANDPELLLWVHATEVDSLLRAHLRYAANPVSAADADRYVTEMAVVARKLGSAPPPTDRASLRAYLKGMRPQLRATGDARETARFLLSPPVPLAALPVYGIVAAGAITLLPRFVRRDLRLPPVLPLAEPLMVRPAASALLGVLDWALAPQHAARTARVQPAGAVSG